VRDQKIAFAHYSAPNDIGGVTTWFERLVLRLKADGRSVAVLLHHLGDDIQESTILAPLVSAGIEVEITPRASSIYGDMKTTLEFLNRHRPSVFAPQCLSATSVAASVAGKQGLPWIMTIHSDDPEYWAIAESVRPAESGGAFVGVSEHISRSILNRGLSRMSETIPCGVAIPSLSARYVASPFRVVYSGRLVETQKRISLVVAALVEACRQSANIEGLLIGDGPERASAERVVLEAGLQERIRFAGRVVPGDVQGELAKCQALLLMSDFEGLPVAVLEAMAVGVVPVVRNIQSGIPELVRHQREGILVTEDPMEAAASLVELAGNPAQWKLCSREATALVSSRFGEESCYRRWTALLDELSAASMVQYPLVSPRSADLGPIDPLMLRLYPNKRSIWRRAVGKIASFSSSRFSER
jgi:colanic acid/amylovoran biosynthesis glycosyltransferase